MSRLLCGPDAVAVDRAAFNWAATQSGENPEDKFSNKIYSNVWEYVSIYLSQYHKRVPWIYHSLFV
jgi:hypothetical protein